MTKKLDVVTGGAGFIGSHLVDRLVKEDRRVRIIDNLDNGSLDNIEQHADNGDVEFIRADVGNPDDVSGIFEDAGRVFHLAALADIVPSIESPTAYYRANVDGTFNVLQEALRCDVKRFVYAASSSCYGIPDTYPTSETAEMRPQYPYALTKLLGEQLVMHWAQVYGLSAVSLRLFNVYGPRARTGGTYGAVFGVFLAQLLAGKPLTVVGDGTQTRDFTFVSDVVEAFVIAADSCAANVCMNVGSRNTYSVSRLVELLGATETVTLPKRPGEPDCTWANVSRIEEILDWRARVSFEDGVQIMLDHIDAWRDAPVWDKDGIEEATRGWFRCLGK